ncbi:uncharacterized protein LOC124438939 [Xenia sp. Carnegie-2017]|uniref:uncharacterized protein LOC124438939 n=1 Tax=Xenia sp. Carnegie-2017 TaxID=2897299 RepID=UPI001F039DEC|nr:uncharacterized protein LOC124438939 [Xenia sp. Carnegie-2017]
MFKVTVLFALLIAVYGEDVKGSAFYRHFMEKRAASVQGSDSVEANKPSGNDKKGFVFQSPGTLVNGQGSYGGFNGYGGYGSYGGFGGLGWAFGHGYGNYGRLHPVPVAGVKALSVAYDEVSGVPYVCDPNKTGGNSTQNDTSENETEKRSKILKDKLEKKKRENDKLQKDETNVEKDADDVEETEEEKKDEIKIKIPDYPPCPDPKKSFPWSCIMGSKSEKRSECATAKKAIRDASGGMYRPLGGMYRPFFGNRLGIPGGYNMGLVGGYGLPIGLPYGYGNFLLG